VSADCDKCGRRAHLCSGYDECAEAAIVRWRERAEDIEEQWESVLSSLASSDLYEKCEADYLGGYREHAEIAIFRHGMATVCNVIKAFAEARRVLGTGKP
jgi:hypothetical protein